MADGLCDICGQAAVKLYSCMLCGKRVCGECVTVSGTCRNCMGGRKIDEVTSEEIKELGRRMLDED